MVSNMSVRCLRAGVCVYVCQHRARGGTCICASASVQTVRMGVHVSVQNVSVQRCGSGTCEGGTQSSLTIVLFNIIEPAFGQSENIDDFDNRREGGF